LRLPKRRRLPASHNKLKISSTFLSLKLRFDGERERAREGSLTVPTTRR
jgi:hypothetical protein